MATSNIFVPFNTTAPIFTSSNKHHLISYISPIGRHRSSVSFTATAGGQVVEKKIVRRSGNYTKTIYDLDAIQSLDHGHYSAKKYSDKASELKEKVKEMLGRDMALVDCLELVDNLERLGIAYHFEPEIMGTLRRKFASREGDFKEKSLYAAALELRVFRQHGFHVPQEILDSFVNEDGEFYQSLSEDTKGLLALYESCFLSLEGEGKLDLAKEFAAKHMKNKLEKNEITDDNLSSLVRHSLEVPLAWRVPRIEARWYIDAYERSPCNNYVLLHLAKLDFNMVQAIHREELIHLISWWKDIEIAEKLPFVRDRMIESYFWVVGVNFEPRYSSWRKMFTTVGIASTVVDDMYEVHGTLEELELFTAAIHRWDLKAADELPDYMKLVFLLLFNTVNGTAYDALKEHGVHVVEHLSKGWAKVTAAVMQEARWSASGYTPAVEEYLQNAIVSAQIPMYLKQTYLIITNPVSIAVLEDSFDRIHPHNLVRWPALLSRLLNDLGTSKAEMQRGEMGKVVECYVREKGCSEEEARKYVWDLIGATWKKMNAACGSPSPFSSTFVSMSLNFARMCVATYHNYGDGYGLTNNSQFQESIKSSLFYPIPGSLA